ncbi:MAG: SxtJ family membrane protein [Verrucomicrobiota bacterium]
MGLRADVIHELKGLDSSTKAMRKFGLVVGAVFMGIGMLGIYKQWPQVISTASGLTGSFLVFCGALFPQWLPPFHRVWMAFALVLGWCMSRLILTLVFVLAIIPIALLGRVMKLPFTQMRRTTPRDSYWVDPPKRDAKHHTDMF